jgi:hypothetical protein
MYKTLLNNKIILKCYRINNFLEYFHNDLLILVAFIHTFISSY